MSHPDNILVMDDDGEIQLRIVQEKDRDRVLDLLRKYFFPDEPLTGSTEPKNAVSEEEEDFILSYIQHGTCVMAVHKQSGQLLGVCMAGPQETDKSDYLFGEAAKEGNKKWGKILKLLACIERDAKVSDRYGVQKILYIIGTCVDASMRGKNIGARLYNAVRNIGRERGFQLLRADCSSFYSAKIKERLGWDCINTVYYKEHLDENNRQIFSPPLPHECCKSYALRL